MQPLTRRSLPLTLMLCGLVMSPATIAAEVTDLPERGGLFAALGYGGSVYRGKMEEDGVGIGARVENHHGLNLSAAYGVASGLVFYARLDYAPATRFVFPDVRPMRFDPATLQGTYRVGDIPSEPLSEDMSGLSGTRIGIRLQPSQWSPNPRPSATKWLVGASFQIPSPNDNMWTHNNGRRGTGSGNLVTRLEASLSKRRGVSDAYTRVLAELGAPTALDIEGANGETLGKNVNLQPPRSVNVQTGLEFDIWGAPAQTLGTLDISLSTTYVSWGDIASGVYLPEVLTSSQGVVVTRSESVRIGGQIGGHLYDASGWTVHAHGGWTWETPYRPEHVYPDIRMTTANANVHWALTVERRFGPSGVSAAIGDAP